MTHKHSPDLINAKKEDIYYSLTMFPYPSGYGLHAGHASVFTYNDVNARYQRMKGKVVLNPFGFDSFGLPTENYAMQQGKAAWQVTEENIEFFLKQIEALDMSFDMERIVTTSDPEYYKWTQWIFLKLYEAGLVYRAEKFVNRCPGCQTVLANDQVIEGRCERCKSEIIQKKHPQWFIKITDYADRLISDLDTIDWPEDTKLAQKNWIGKSEGCEIDFKVDEKTKITCFTTRIDTVYGVTAVVLAPENTIIDEYLSLEHKTKVIAYRKESMAKTAVQRQQDTKEKTGVKSGIFVIHPLTGAEIPVWYADYVLMDYGTGAVMMVPMHDERDFEFATVHGIPKIEVVARETGNIRENEVFVDGAAGVVFDPVQQRYAIGEWPDGRLSFFAGGVNEGETVKNAIIREVQEESGLHDFGDIIYLHTSFAHYFNKAKQSNRNARAESYLFVCKSSDVKPVALEEHEKFKLSWKTATEIREYWLANNAEHNYDHYLRFLNQGVVKAIELGYDMSSNPQEFKNIVMTEYGVLEHSGEFSGMRSAEAKKAIATHLESIAAGQTKITYRLRDWSVSRQRYWGSPIPMYYDEHNTPHPIPESELPVVLPRDIANYKPKGKSPLEDHASFPIYHKKPTVLMIHGRSNYPGDGSVLDALVDAYTANGYHVIYETYSYHEDYDFQKQLEKLKTIEADIVVGHSTGGYLALQYAMMSSVSKVICIAPALPYLSSELQFNTMIQDWQGENAPKYFSFHQNEIETKKLENKEVIAIFGGMQDKYIPASFSDRLQAYIPNAKIITCNERGHMGSDEANKDYKDLIHLLNISENSEHSYKRECDTLDTFMCSSFYFLRYPDAHNPDELIRKELAEKMFPVDLYTGGKEHTVGHLLYSRFIHKFLYDQGYVSSPEPFAKLVHQGMILGSDGRKMGKRYGNVIDPLDVVASYGSDAVRTYLMFMGPVEQEKIRNDNALKGIKRFLERIERACLGVKTMQVPDNAEKIQKSLESLTHKTIKGMTHDLEQMKYNTAVSKLMILLNAIEDAGSLVSKEILETYLHLLAPFAPKISQDIWTKFGHSDDITMRTRPSYDPAKVVDDEIIVPVQINGKRRLELTVPADANEDFVMDAFCATEDFGKYIGEQSIKKVIYVKGKILNVVV